MFWASPEEPWCVLEQDIITFYPLLTTGSIQAEIHKQMGKTPGQTASSDLGLCSLSRPFWQTASVQNFRTYTVSPVFG